MNLYLDGARVARRADVRTGMSREGWWRVGGDNLSNWPNRPSSDYFAGSIDEVAVYHHGLSAADIRDHYVKSGRTLSGAPTDAYGAAVYRDGPSTYWRLAETSGTTASDSSLSRSPGPTSTVRRWVGRARSARPATGRPASTATTTSWPPTPEDGA